MHWSYRLVMTEQGLAVYEVYFDDSGQATAMSEKPETAVLETVEQLREELDLIKAALDQPIIKIDSIGCRDHCEKT